MILCSTRNSALRTTWRDAVLRGIAPDGGLFIPRKLPTLTECEVDALRGKTLAEVATELSLRFMGDEIEREIILNICSDALNFKAPLVRISESTDVLELFHGPTCAFKDFGARYMARLFRYFWGTSSAPLTVLVATSGDTGSAVAHAFYDPSPNPLIRVTILFPRNKVSDIQRKQMTTLGHNVTAFEVAGSFDDCQALVKRALQDTDVLRHRALTSANSINIARLLPQMFYYAYTTLQYTPEQLPTFIVPSGNLGNLTGALMSHLCGFKTLRCVAACNINRSFPEFLSSGTYHERRSQETISNAMDVGAPSNFYRINHLMGQPSEESLLSVADPQTGIFAGYSITDEVTRRTMHSYHAMHRYILDPHTAVGAAALEQHQAKHPTEQGPMVVVATAHPAKFSKVVEDTLGLHIDLPEQLRATLALPEHSIPIEADYQAFVQHLTSSKS